MNRSPFFIIYIKKIKNGSLNTPAVSTRIKTCRFCGNAGALMVLPEEKMCETVSIL